MGTTKRVRVRSRGDLDLLRRLLADPLLTVAEARREVRRERQARRVRKSATLPG